MRNDDGQTPAQRQAAAKLALRKQLEKTLLQVNTVLLYANNNLRQFKLGDVNLIDCFF